MGMAPQVFYELTPAEFFHTWIAWRHKQNEEERLRWERTRWHAYATTLIHVDKNSRVSITQMFPLPWDAESEKQPTVMSLEERKNRVREILGEGDNEQESS